MTTHPTNHSELARKIRAFLDQYGIEPGQSQEARSMRLLQLLKQNRGRRFVRTLEEYRNSRATLQDVFDCFRTPEEANLYITATGPIEVAAEVGAVLYSIVAPLLVPGSRVADLGCFTGGHLAWMASQHPECKFVGFDCHAKAIQFAGQLCSLPNASFVWWNYETQPPPPVEPFDVLFSSFGLNTHQVKENMRALGEEFLLGLHHLRHSGLYKSVNEATKPCFGSWRSIARDGARLVAAMRIPVVEAHLAVVDAACDAGWNLDLPGSCFVPRDKETFTVLAFTAEEPVEHDERDLVRWFGQANATDSTSCFYGNRAIAEYLDLAGRTAIGSRTFVFDGCSPLMLVEVGYWQRGGYVLHRDTAGYCQLELVSRSDVALIDLEELDLEDLPLILGE